LVILKVKEINYLNTMNKIISFCLYGDKHKYCGGAIINAQLASIIYPDWECWFYYDDTVPKIVISILNGFSNCKTIHVQDGSWGMMWRFRAMQKDTIVLSRDTDSRLSQREKRIVDEWLASDKSLLTIRDHRAHYEVPICGGMWGLKNGIPENLQSIMNEYSKIPDKKEYTFHHDDPLFMQDQYYLRDVIWPLYSGGVNWPAQQSNTDCMVAGIYETPWMQQTYQQTGLNFIGQSYDENDSPIFPASM